MTSTADASNADAFASALREPGEHFVDVPISCSITRFGLRHAHSLVPCYLDFRRVRREADGLPLDRLLRSAFVVENPKTWYSLSFWRGVPEISAPVPAHVEAARNAFGRVVVEPGRGPEVWSTKWRLVSVSNNLNWGELDWRGVVAESALEPSRG